MRNDSSVVLVAESIDEDYQDIVILPGHSALIRPVDGCWLEVIIDPDEEAKGVVIDSVNGSEIANITIKGGEHGKG